jgi:hypothetical protein
LTILLVILGSIESSSSSSSLQNFLILLCNPFILRFLVIIYKKQLGEEKLLEFVKRHTLVNLVAWKKVFLLEKLFYIFDSEIRLDPRDDHRVDEIELCDKASPCKVHRRVRLVWTAEKVLQLPLESLLDFFRKMMLAQTTFL